MNSAFVVTLLWMAVTAAASSTLPVYADFLHNHYSKEDVRHRHTSCDITDCYKEILEKPIFIVNKLKGQATYEVYYSPKGLNNLNKDLATRPLSEAIRTGDKVAVVYPLDGFPVDQFPGIRETNFVVPEYKISFSEFFRDTPILVLYSNEDFSKLKEKVNYLIVADLDVQDTGFSLSKEYSLPTVSSTVDVNDYSPLFYILPASTPLASHRHTIHYLAPSVETLTPIHSSSIFAYAPVPPPNSSPSGFGASSPFLLKLFPYEI